MKIGYGAILTIVLTIVMVAGTLYFEKKEKQSEDE